jgi:hypothetical protein
VEISDQARHTTRDGKDRLADPGSVFVVYRMNLIALPEEAIATNELF